MDSRPAVRKSAGQTLFSTIAAHGDLLQAKTWQSLLWKVSGLEAEPSGLEAMPAAFPLIILSCYINYNSSSM